MMRQVNQWKCPSCCQTHSWCPLVTQGQGVVRSLLNDANQCEQSNAIPSLFCSALSCVSPVPILWGSASAPCTVGGNDLELGSNKMWGAKLFTVIWNQCCSMGRRWEQSPRRDSPLIRWAFLCYYQNRLWGDLNYMLKGEHDLIESRGLKTVPLPVTSYLRAVSSAEKQS